MRIILAFLLFLTCFPSLACRPTPFDFEKEISEADIVAIAYVTGILATEAEADLLGNKENSELIEFRISVPIQKNVRFITARTIKCTANKIYQTSSSCSFSGDLMHKVVLFKKGSRVWVRELNDEAVNILESIE